MPKVTDLTTPGKSIEFPAPWMEWIEEYSTNGRIYVLDDDYKSIKKSAHKAINDYSCWRMEMDYNTNHGVIMMLKAYKYRILSQ